MVRATTLSAALLLIAGCARGPTYLEALQTERLEREAMLEHAKLIGAVPGPGTSTDEVIRRLDREVNETRELRARVKYAENVRREIGAREGRNAESALAE
jgi:hypothetical protein